MKIDNCYFDVLGYLLINIRTLTEKDKAIFDTCIQTSPKQIAEHFGYKEKQVTKALCKAIKDGVINVSKEGENKYEINIKNFYKKSVKNG